MFSLLLAPADPVPEDEPPPCVFHYLPVRYTLIHSVDLRTGEETFHGGTTEALRCSSHTPSAPFYDSSLPLPQPQTEIPLSSLTLPSGTILAPPATSKPCRQPGSPASVCGALM